MDLFDSLDSDGFSTGTPMLALMHKQTANTYVGWSWLGGGTAVSNTDGSITSSVSANTKAGFSVLSLYRHRLCWHSRSWLRQRA